MTETAPALDDAPPEPRDAGMAPEMAAPLARFGGERPPAPAWFDAALARSPERSRVAVDGAGIELLTWGQVGRPGLIFVHGNSANADWWSFIAPFFADAWRVAALSLSGMGGSDWRERYGFATFAGEIAACAEAAGLNAAPVRPVYIGHSFGGGIVGYCARRHPERMRAAVLLDTGFGAPPTAEQAARWEAEAKARGEARGRWRGPAERPGANRVYASLAMALARFRFLPPQVAGNLYIADYIARASLKRAPLAPEHESDGGEGWTWKFDPGLWGKLDRADLESAPSLGATPMAHIWGDRSEIIRRREAAIGQGPADVVPPGSPTIIIPESEHHLMVDQPLALVAALRALLAAWPATGG